MKKSSILIFMCMVCTLKAQNYRWAWAVGNTFCPDTILPTDNYYALQERQLSPVWMDTDTSGNVFIIGYTPKDINISKLPMLMDFNGLKQKLDYHFSSNMNVYFLMKLNPKGELVFGKLIASVGIPPAIGNQQQVIEMDREKGNIYMGFQGQSYAYPVYIGEVSPLIPAKQQSSFAIVIDKNGNYVNKIEVADPGSSSIVKFLFPGNNKVYIQSAAGKTAPDFQKTGRLSVYDYTMDTITAVYKHFYSGTPYLAIKNGTMNLLKEGMEEIDVSGNTVKSALALPAYINTVEINQLLQRKNGNYIFSYKNAFTGHLQIAEVTSTSKLKWLMYQTGAASQLLQFDDHENVWVFFDRRTDSMKALPKGYSSPFIAKIDTVHGNRFVEEIIPTHLITYSVAQPTPARCFKSFNNNFYIAGYYPTMAEFGDNLLFYSCEGNSLPLQQYIAKAEPGWQQTRKNLGNGYLNETEIAIFPNPVYDKIKVKVENPVLIQHYILLDLQGRIVKQFSGASGNELNISEIESGTYILRLVNNNNQYVSLRICKQ